MTQATVIHATNTTMKIGSEMAEPISEQELQFLGLYAKNNKGYESGMLIEKISAAYRAQREEIEQLKRRNDQWSRCCKERDAALARDNPPRQTVTRGMTESEVRVAINLQLGTIDYRQAAKKALLEILRDKGLLIEDDPEPEEDDDRDQIDGVTVTECEEQEYLHSGSLALHLKELAEDRTASLAEVERLSVMNDMRLDEIKDLLERVERLREENAKLKSALTEALLYHEICTPPTELHDKLHEALGHVSVCRNGVYFWESAITKAAEEGLSHAE